MSTKIHLAMRGLGCPVRFAITAGQRGDAPQAEALLADLPDAVVLADAAYDSDRLREAIVRKGATAVIPNNPSRAKKYELDTALYTANYLIECHFYKRKQFRRATARFKKTAKNYATVVTIATIILWLR